jgi:hypothetical protein
MSYKKTWIYTCLMGDYEKLNELQSAADSKIPKFCFTDDPSLKSETWTIRLVIPAFQMDSLRSQRRVKILAHEYLPEFEASLYVDNTVGLRVAPERLFDEYLRESDIAAPLHSFRNSVLDEFVTVAKEGLDEPSRIFEQLNHYQLTNVDVLEQRPYWAGILLRHHNRPKVREGMVNWYNHVMRYSRRDQLSFNMAMMEVGTDVRGIEINNFGSWFHEWPLSAHRNTSKRLTSFGMSGASILAQVKSVQLERDGQIANLNQAVAERNGQIAKLNQAVAELNGQIANLDLQIAQMRSSNSWRITFPLREIRRLVAAPVITGKGVLKKT